MNKPAKLQVWGGATSRTLRPHWMLHELDIDYEAKLIGSRTGETQDPAFRKLNPKEKIPVLVDGDFILTESVAIVTYLGDHYGADGQPRLVPAPNTLARARYNEWMSFVQMELDAHTLYVIRKHRDLANLYGEAPAAVETAISGFDKQVGVAQQQLNRTPYLLGDDFSAADLTRCLTSYPDGSVAGVRGPLSDPLEIAIVSALRLGIFFFAPSNAQPNKRIDPQGQAYRLTGGRLM